MTAGGTTDSGKKNCMTLIKDVSDTAFMIARYRAIETARPDALFRDPLADVLGGEHGRAIVASRPRRNFMSWVVVIRTVIIDDLITEAIANGVTTVLNLGAGLDTRPYRMNLPATLRWVEVDYPHIVELKETRLKNETPRCKLERVKLDLADVPARQALFSQINSTSAKTLVLTEGLVPYLNNDQAGALANDLRAQPNFRYWIVDYFSPFVMKYRERRPHRFHMKNAPFLFKPPDYFGFFKDHTWKPLDIRYIPREAKRLNRPIPLPPLAMAWMAIRSIFISRNQKREFSKFSGYVLLEPDAA
jgi:methyltransferase (TIGR00027 family)